MYAQEKYCIYRVWYYSLFQASWNVPSMNKGGLLYTQYLNCWIKRKSLINTATAELRFSPATRKMGLHHLSGTEETSWARSSKANDGDQSKVRSVVRIQWLSHAVRWLGTEMPAIEIGFSQSMRISTWGYLLLWLIKNGPRSNSIWKVGH